MFDPDAGVSRLNRFMVCHGACLTAGTLRLGLDYVYNTS
jgi:hypothetical protein